MEDKYELLKHYNDTYDAYCEFLKKKYGEVPGDYFEVRPEIKKANPRRRKFSYNEMRKNNKIARGNEGLFIHHILETEHDMLCSMDSCERREIPIYYHFSQNLVYCNLLEHYLLHILIEKDGYRRIGVSGGIFIWIGPELNDIYSGFEPKPAWKKVVYSLVKDQEEAYIALIHAFIKDFPNELSAKDFCISYNNMEKDKTERIFKLIKNENEKCIDDVAVSI